MYQYLGVELDKALLFVKNFLNAVTALKKLNDCIIVHVLLFIYKIINMNPEEIVFAFFVLLFIIVLNLFTFDAL